MLFPPPQAARQFKRTTAPLAESSPPTCTIGAGIRVRNLPIGAEPSSPGAISPSPLRTAGHSRYSQHLRLNQVCQSQSWWPPQNVHGSSVLSGPAAAETHWPCHARSNSLPGPASHRQDHPAARCRHVQRQLHTITLQVIKLFPSPADPGLPTHSMLPQAP